MIIENFIPTSFEYDKDLVSRTKIALITNLLVAIATVIFLLLYFFIGNKIGAILIGLTTISLTLNFFIIKKSANLSLFSNIVCFSAFCAINIALNTSGGISESLAFCWFFPLSVLSFILLKRKYAWSWTVICILNYFGVYFIDTYIVNIPNFVEPSKRAFIDLATIIGSFLVLGAFNQVFQSGINTSKNELNLEKSLIEEKVKEAIKEIEEKNKEISITNKKVDEQNKNLEIKNLELEESIKEIERTQTDLELEKEKLKENHFYLAILWTKKL